MAARARSLARVAALAVVVFAACSASALSLGHVDPGAPAPDFSAPGADGHVHHLSDYAGKIVVLEWTSPVCPYTALKYRDGEMQALQKRAAADGVVWISIDTAPPGRPGYLAPAAMRTRMAAMGMRVTAFLSDADGRIGRAYGAKTTPQLYVVGRDGRLVYEGAIDDNPSQTAPGASTFVGAALADLRAGKPVETPQTRPYGCAVEY